MTLPSILSLEMDAAISIACDAAVGDAVTLEEVQELLARNEESPVQPPSPTIPLYDPFLPDV